MEQVFRTIRIPEFPIDRRSAQYANEIAAQDGVRDVLLLPDCFTKEKYVGLEYKITIPSSSVIVTEREVLYPQFRSRGINCGMMVVKLPILADELTPELVHDIMRAMTFGPLYFAAYRFRLPFFRGSYDLSKEAFVEVLEEGSHRFAERFQLTVDRVAKREKVALAEVRHLLNEEWLTKRTVRMRHSFARYFGGNHFFEIQKAHRDAPSLGLVKDQVCIMLHTGCQGIESMIREDLSKQYFEKNEGYVPAKKGGEMYEAFFAAQKMLLHYGDTYRVASYALINDVLKRHVGGSATIVVNKGHNFVEERILDGENVLIYHHNTEGMNEGEHAIISGSYDHASYIVVGGAGVSHTNYSIDHGIGEILNQDTHKRVVESDTITRYRFNRGITGWKNVTKVPRTESVYANSYFSLLGEKNIARVVVELLPLINMKYAK